jgi:hypothetical protein
MPSYELGVFVFGERAIKEAALPFVPLAPSYSAAPSANSIVTPLGNI